MPELRELIDKSRELYPQAFPGCKFKEVEKIKALYKITDLEQKTARNLGNTGIMFFINDNKYYIKK